MSLPRLPPPRSAGVRSRLGTALLTLPDPVLEQFFSGVIGYGSRDVPEAISAPDAERRLLIAPANYAGQGYAWARAAETLPGVGASNLFVTSMPGPGFPADNHVSTEVFQKSHRWGRRQAAAVAAGFTHVLVEAERPLLGRAQRADVRREHAFLRHAGVSVAYVSHGSDLRLPSRHAELDVWSPYRDVDWDMLPVLERVAAENARFLDDVDEPVFVVTPELLLDHPSAVWLPNCIDPAHWRSTTRALQRARPRVVHAPTNARLKGSDLVQPAIERLERQHVIEYRRVSGVAPERMPELYAWADVVLDQFRIGIYSTTAIEAMAAGRLVVAHVDPAVRAVAEARAGMPLPIVEATPDTIADVLSDIATSGGKYLETVRSGPAYVEAVHSRSSAAAVLQGFLGAVS